MTLSVGPPNFPVVIYKKCSGARAAVGRHFLEHCLALTLKNTETTPTL